MRLTEERRKLLVDSVKLHDGVLKMSHAFAIYSSKESAKSAVKSLESYGYVEYDRPGYFKIKELPEELSHLDSELNHSEDVSNREFVRSILEKVFHKIRRKNPKIDEEKVKFVPD